MDTDLSVRRSGERVHLTDNVSNLQTCLVRGLSGRHMRDLDTFVRLVEAHAEARLQTSEALRIRFARHEAQQGVDLIGAIMRMV